MTQHPNLFAALAAPFDDSEVKSYEKKDRSGKPIIGRNGKPLTIWYVTARTVMNRFDSVLGPENWWDEYSVQNEKSVLCKLSIRLPDGLVLTKHDAGGCAGMADAGDDDKSAVSDAFKRAAVKFGVGRYLYRDGVPSFQVSGPAAPSGSQKSLPAPEAPPATNGHGANGQAKRTWPNKGPGTAGVQPRATAAAVETNAPDNRRRRGADAPETGGQLFAWASQYDRKHKTNVLRQLTDWAKARGFPNRMVDWGNGQAIEGYAKVCQILDGSDE